MTQPRWASQRNWSYRSNCIRSIWVILDANNWQKARAWKPNANSSLLRPCEEPWSGLEVWPVSRIPPIFLWDNCTKCPKLAEYPTDLAGRYPLQLFNSPARNRVSHGKAAIFDKNWYPAAFRTSLDDTIKTYVMCRIPHTGVETTCLEHTWKTRPIMQHDPRSKS
jgi:hypothetical protein